MNIVKRIIKANQGRDPERLAMKYHAMRTSTFAFLRGSCHLFYDRLVDYEVGTSGPLVWCSGDLHIENFGSYKGDNRLVYFDINDFDEAALAPATWELIRFVTSVFVGASEFNISPEHARELAAHFLEKYRAALAEGKARWIERETAGGVVKELLDQLRDRRRVDFLDSRTRKKGKFRRFLVDGKKTLPVTDTERSKIECLMGRIANNQANPEFYRVIDVARRIAGTGSLGVARYAILVEGKGSPDQNYLLDLKQAGPSSIGSHFRSVQPRWHSEAERIVTLQRRCQAVGIAFLHPVAIEDTSYVLRALQPVEDRLPFARFQHHPSLFDEAMQIMGACVAWSHLRGAGRQGSAIADELVELGTKKKWVTKLIQVAGRLAQQTTADWTKYCDAYDAGAFHP